MPPPRPTRYDRQQDAQDQKRDEQARQRDQEQNRNISNLQNRLTGVESEVVQQGGQASTLQRFRIHVPTPYTHFLLGQRYTKDPPFGYTGASLQTDGNLFIDIKENTVAQTKGFTVLQTSKGWQQYASSIMELSSPTAVKMVGGQVFLGAINGVQAPTENRPNHGEELTTNPVNDLTPAITHLTSVSSNYDMGLSVLSLIATGVFFSPLDMADVHNKIKTAETAWSTGKKLYDLYGKLTAGSAPKKDVNIYGEEGVNVMSPKNVMLTSQKSIKLFSHWGVTIGSSASSTMMAVQGVKCFGGLKASLEGGTYADVKAGMELGVSCLRGKLKLKGKTIDIGADKPKWTQLATEKLTLTATKKVLIDSKEIEIGALERNGKTITNHKITMTAKEKIHLDSKDAFEVKSKKVVQIQVGSYAIEIKTDAIKIGKGSNGQPKDPMITIKGQTITLDSSGMGVEVNKNTVKMGKGNNLVRVTGSGDIAVKGKKVLLG